LAPGPAAATHNISRFGFFKFAKFTGTGFAYPNANFPPLANNNTAGTTSVPIGSMCLTGFSVMRPS